jgi:hypothetical protein
LQAPCLAQQISLVDLSGASFAWLRHSTESAAADLDILQRRYQMRRFPVRWVRGRLRELLGTAPLPEFVGAYPEPDARQFAEAAMPVLDRLYETLSERQRTELLLGFPAAPFILPLATDDIGQFLRYASERPEHEIRLRRTGEGREAEWTISPAAQGSPDLQLARRESYWLAFDLPERLELWISEHEEHRTSRIRAVKKQFLSDIIIYRMEDDTLQTFQLQYHPSDLRRARRSG